MKRLIALLLVLAFAFCGCVSTLPSDGGINNSDVSWTLVPENSQQPPDKSFAPDGNMPPEGEQPPEKTDGSMPPEESLTPPDIDIFNIPPFSGEPYVAINDNNPEFAESDLVTDSYEYYSELDYLGRCGVTMACIGRDIMPTEERGEIGYVKPTGWVNNKYDKELVDGGYLYNRCHLIGFQLTGENANVCNLITGTRYMNVQGMLPFENMVADYVKETGNHVIYRVTPIFNGEELLARGVQMEAYSVEDDGDGICFNVFCYNAQPGIFIEYSTGDNYLDESDENQNPEEQTHYYVLNTNSKKFHYESCSSVDKISDDNRRGITKSREALIAEGYSPCGNCKP